MNWYEPALYYIDVHSSTEHLIRHFVVIYLVTA